VTCDQSLRFRLPLKPLDHRQLQPSCAGITRPSVFMIWETAKLRERSRLISPMSGFTAPERRNTVVPILSANWNRGPSRSTAGAKTWPQFTFTSTMMLAAGQLAMRSSCNDSLIRRQTNQCSHAPVFKAQVLSGYFCLNRSGICPSTV